MKGRFTNKVAIVTGAAIGIGYQIAYTLCKEGASVVLNDINPDAAEKAVRKIVEETDNPNCIAYVGSSGDTTVIMNMVDKAVQQFGQLHIAVANAGITLFGNFLTYPFADFMKVLEVNMGGSFFLAQAAAKQIIKQQTGGSLLFMSSVTGHQAHKNLAAYGMTKAALEMLAKNLVMELSSYGINVNTVAPGATATERTMENPDYEAIWSRITPMGRPASTQDIAEAVLFLISDNARHITGQSLVVDGGWTSVSPSPYDE